MNSELSELSPELGCFEDFGLKKELIKSIEGAGFTIPSPIQVKAIPLVLAGRDIIGQAQTGSGKTAAFVIPALQKLAYDKTVEVLVLVPTRELCKQVVLEFDRLGRYTNTKTTVVVGGESSFRQIEQVNRGSQVVVATPGRLLDHLKSKNFKNFAPKLVILDEADEMLDMGFIDDIRMILSYTSSERQTLLFSATMPGPIARLAKEELKEPEHIKLVDKEATHADIEQLLYLVRPNERADALIRLIDSENPAKAVVFCRTKRDTADLCERLVRSGISAKALHGDLSQEDRSRAITEIKGGYTRVLVATDVASRGLDIPDLSHVFNFQVPENKERYTHRIGRTGRAGNKGKAITILTPQEYRSQYHLRQNKHITLKEIPNRKHTQIIRETLFFSDIQNLEATPEAEAACSRFIEENLAYEFLEKLYTFVTQKQRVSGPESMGFTLKDVEKMMQSRSGGGGGGGGGYRARPTSGGAYRARPTSGGGYRGNAAEGRSGGGGGYHSRTSEDRTASSSPSRGKPFKSKSRA